MKGFPSHAFRRRRAHRAIRLTLKTEIVIREPELDEAWMQHWFGPERRTHPMMHMVTRPRKPDLLRWACRPCLDKLCVWFRFEEDAIKFMLFHGGKWNRETPGMVKEMNDWLYKIDFRW